MSVGIIYAIINIIDDKLYVGQAIDKDKRWKNHKIALQCNKHPNRYLQSAYNKYGVDAFIYVVLEKVEDLKLTEREQYWMDVTGCYDRELGYNLAPAAGSPLGFKHSEETKLKLSKIHKGQKRSEEFKLKISKSWETRIVSEETREKLRLSHLGHIQSEETKTKRASSMIGNKNNAGKKRKTPTSEETRRKISVANREAHRRRKAALDKS